MPSDEVKLELCKILNCSLNYLLGKSDTRTPVDINEVKFANAGGLNVQDLGIDEIEDEYNKYLDLQNDIDDYTEENDLDDVLNEKEIKEHFKSKINEDLFELNQACLKTDFVEYMANIINKRNKNIRKANIMFNKNGNGFTTTRITIPVGWTKELGFSEEDKEAKISLDNNKIIIEKKVAN